MAEHLFMLPIVALQQIQYHERMHSSNSEDCGMRTILELKQVTSLPSRAQFGSMEMRKARVHTRP